MKARLYVISPYKTLKNGLNFTQISRRYIECSLQRFCVYDMSITWSSGHVTLENEAKVYIVITWREVHKRRRNSEKGVETVIVFSSL